MIFLYKRSLIFCVVFFVVFSLQGQQSEIENQYFLNPWITNPAQFPDNDRLISLSYKEQWGGLEGAPTYGRFAFQNVKFKSIYLGGIVKYFEEGPFEEFETLALLGYKASLSNIASLKFGMSFGYGNRSFNLNELSDPGDVGLGGISSSRSFFQGSAGLSFQINNFHIGASIPSLFEENITGNEIISLSGPENFFLSASYTFKNPISSVSFVPQILYHIDNNLGINQYEVVGTGYYKDLFWLGGMHRENFGTSMHAGFKVKQLDVSYIYSFSSLGSDIGLSSHEMVLRFRLGKKSNKTQVATTESSAEVGQIERDNFNTVIEEEEKVEEVNEDESLASESVDENVQEIDDADEEPAPEAIDVTPPSEPISESKQPISGQGEKKTEESITEKSKDNVPIVGSVSSQENLDPSEKPSDVPNNRDTLANDVSYENPTDIETNEAFSEIGNDLIIHENVKVTDLYNQSYELSSGNYLVLGVFRFQNHAIELKKKLLSLGVSNKVIFLEGKKLYYVYAGSYQDEDQTQRNLERLKDATGIKDAWIFRVNSD